MTASGVLLLLLSVNYGKLRRGGKGSRILSFLFLLLQLPPNYERMVPIETSQCKCVVVPPAWSDKSICPFCHGLILSLSFILLFWLVTLCPLWLSFFSASHLLLLAEAAVVVVQMKLSLAVVNCRAWRQKVSLIQFNCSSRCLLTFSFLFSFSWSELEVIRWTRLLPNSRICWLDCFKIAIHFWQCSQWPSFLAFVLTR